MNQVKADGQRANSEVEVNSPRSSQVPEKVKGKGKVEEDDEDVASSQFRSDDSDDFKVTCNVVSVLPQEFEEVEKDLDGFDEMEEYFDIKEGPVVTHNPWLCDPTNAALFPRPYGDMQAHLKPLFIKAKVEAFIVKRVLIDGGAAVNLIPEHMLKKMGKCALDTMAHNMVITDFNGQKSSSPGCIALDIKVGTVVRTTLFVIVPSKANYNLLLGREWIHGVGAVPSTLHQCMFLWNQMGQIELIKGDDEYFRYEVNSAEFERNLSRIEPMDIPKHGEPMGKHTASVRLEEDQIYLKRLSLYEPAISQRDSLYSLYRHIQPTGWGDEEEDLCPTCGNCPSEKAKGQAVAGEDDPVKYKTPRTSFPYIPPTGWDD